MLKHLHIKNFQSHEDTLLEFSPGVNVIVGKSDAGKSACMRAIHWVLNNRPLGDSFIRQGQEEAEVEMLCGGVRGDVQVKRVRGKSKNTYDLQSDVFQGSFTSFGQSPPKEVTLALNLSDINTQGQFSPSFLVFDSPGIVADYLRNITGMEKLDKSVDITSKRLRSSKAKSVEKQEELKGVESELKSLGELGLDVLEKLLEEADELIVIHSDTKGKSAQIEALVSTIKDLQRQAILLPVPQIKHLGETSKVLCDEWMQGTQQIKEVSQCLDRIQKCESDKLNIPENVSDLLLQKSRIVEQMLEFAQKSVKVSDILVSLQETAKEIQQYNEKKKNCEVEVSELYQQLVECPLCGSVLNEVSKAKLLGD